MTETSFPLTPPTKRLRANSKGEELYFVHLQRMTAPDPHPEDAEDDHDYEAPRKPNKTIGEELFEVHLKRSQGLEPDYDVDHDGKGSDGKSAAKGSKIESQTKSSYCLKNGKDNMAE
mmetsp:Transcript_47436/g.100804  ORF Transcript_47436/g.100804 Transcript_47436/m.100804 type:complete len:117 (-) Transcript_47436:201-551(-)|eukprot:CAMPEP_0172578038 /NCGR_PEP_ID=MMETSP1067-20121228/138533_1 /TAXON_ID=265564 ORGANISM="Thalassiosira punctigera, Strain Tpunct2005C2" /NCGR_SAMPLE_ID=MMETSP1067 /ASSEMBLY_ACC=CAM_ASM_000444 /LENGTH=116 /DNA_ID=CAMNT_0013370731 /DNA_START=184 /DNA_END=534 /DNA_ORIENTATION=-